MKKLLSVILTIVMLVMPLAEVAVFAAPSVSHTSDSVREQSDVSANLAEETEYIIQYSAGRNSVLSEGKNPPIDQITENGQVRVRAASFLRRYESTKAGYVIDGWTDGLNVYEAGGTYTFTCDTTLTPNVVPEGDSYIIIFNVADEFKSLYDGPAKIKVAVNEETDLSEFVIAEKAGYIVLGWKIAVTEEIVSSVNGSTDGQVITLEAACVRDVVDITLENNTITTDSGTLELNATLERPYAPDAEFDRTITWSIKQGEKFATLEGNVLTAIWNTTAEDSLVVTATPAFDPTQTKDFNITITGQSGFEVRYDKNTGATVANMPFEGSCDMAKESYTVSGVVPTRSGYCFDGWMLSRDADETVDSEIYLNDNITLYARWTKGGYFNSFDNPADRVNSYGDTVILADGNYFETDLRFARDVSVSDGSIHMTYGGTSGRSSDFRVVFRANNQIDISNVDKVVLGLRTDVAKTVGYIIYYSTKDANGNWIANTSAYDANKVQGSRVTTNGDINTVHELVVDMSKANQSFWDGYLDTFRFSSPDSTLNDHEIWFDYIKFVGPTSVESIDLIVEAPKTKDIKYGTEAVTSNSNKIVATNVEWQGDLLAGTYFDSAKVYTANVELEARDGYVISDEPVSVTVNGEDVSDTFEYADGKAYVSYTFDETQELVIPGDINEDGVFNYFDVSNLFAYYRSKSILGEVDSDINGDGIFNYYDVSRLYAIYRGKASFNGDSSAPSYDFGSSSAPYGSASIHTETSDSFLSPGQSFVYKVYLSGTYDGYSFKVPKSFEGINVTKVEPNDGCYADDIGDYYMVSVLGGKGRYDSSSTLIATVTATADGSIVSGQRVLALTDVQISSDIGEDAGCYTSYATVNVYVVPSYVEIDKESQVLNVGDTYKLSATVYPENASNKNVTWTTSDPDVVTVENGVVVATGAGSATVTVTTEDGNKTAECYITVKVPVESVSIDTVVPLLEVGDAPIQLVATVYPLNATNKNVTWSSSDSDVVSVENGVITAITPGSATITVTTEDGNKTAWCEVTVDDYDAFVYVNAKSTVSRGMVFTFNVSLKGTYDGFAFSVPKNIDSLEILGFETSDAEVNVDEREDDYLVSVLGGKSRVDSDEIIIVTFTAKFDAETEPGIKELYLTDVMITSELGERASRLCEFASINVVNREPGDINGDGVFNYYDVSKLYAFYRGKSTLDDGADSDINADGKFDYYDVSRLYAIFRGKAEFPQ